MVRSTSRLRSLLDRLPPRVWAWALLALTLFPLGFLTRNGSAYFLYPPLAGAALLLTVPPGVPRWTVDWRLLTPLLALFLWGLVTFLWTTALGQAAARWSPALFLSVLTILGYGAASEATAAERRAGLWPSRWLAMACVGVLLYRLVVPPAQQESMQQEPGSSVLARTHLPGHA